MDRPVSGVTIGSGWDCESIATLLSDALPEELDLLDPLKAWGRPPASGLLAVEPSDEAECCWLKGRRIVSRARVSAFCGDRLVGFAEAVVLQIQDQDAPKPTPKSASQEPVEDLSAERRCCRICLESDKVDKTLELLDSVCACRGSARYICKECLVLQWKAKADKSLAKMSDFYCGLCKQKFESKAIEILTEQLKGHLEEAKVVTPEAEQEKLKASVQTATSLWQSGKLKESVALFREIIPALDNADACKPHALSAHHNLSLVLLAMGRAEEATEEVRAARKGFARLYGVQHQLVLKAAHNEAMIANSSGRREEAQELYRTTLELREQVLGPEHVDTLKTRCNYGLSLQSSGKTAESEAVLRRTLASLERVVGRRHPLSLTVMQNLSLALSTRAKEHGSDAAALSSAAEFLARGAVEGKQKAHGLRHPDTLEARRDLATILLASGKRAEAEAVYRQALAGMEEALGFDHTLTKAVLSQLHKSLEVHDRTAAAKLVEDYRNGLLIGDVEIPAEEPQWWGPPVIVLLGVYVTSSMRRQGVGRALVGHFRKLASELGAEMVEAVMTVRQESSLRFLERSGFQLTDQESGAEADGKMLKFRME